MKKFGVLTFLICLCFSAMAARVTGGYMPIISTGPVATYPAGATVTFGVTLAKPAQGNQTFNVSTSTPGKWASLPSSVTVLNGNTTAQFNATLSSTATGELDVTISEGSYHWTEILFVSP